MNILLVSPRTPDTFWSFSHIMRLVGRKSAFPPLGLLTVAAMLPREWSLRVVDLNVRGLADADIRWADAVFLSAMIVHEASAREVEHFGWSTADFTALIDARPAREARAARIQAIAPASFRICSCGYTEDVCPSLHDTAVA